MPYGNKSIKIQGLGRRPDGLFDRDFGYGTYPAGNGQQAVDS